MMIEIVVKLTTQVLVTLGGNLRQGQTTPEIWLKLSHLIDLGELHQIYWQITHITQNVAVISSVIHYYYLK